MDRSAVPESSVKRQKFFLQMVEPSCDFKISFHFLQIPSTKHIRPKYMLDHIRLVGSWILDDAHFKKNCFDTAPGSSRDTNVQRRAFFKRKCIKVHLLPKSCSKAASTQAIRFVQMWVLISCSPRIQLTVLLPSSCAANCWQLDIWHKKSQVVTATNNISNLQPRVQ